MSFVLAILIALVTLVAAILGIFDLKTWGTEPPAQNGETGRGKLTTWGLLKIVCAAAVFVLIGLSEYLKSQASSEAAQREQALHQQIARLQDKAKATSEKLDQARESLRATLRKTDIIERSTRGQMTRHGSYVVEFSDATSVNIPLRNQGGSYVPANGDEISWSLFCRRGPIPEFTGQAKPIGCDDQNFGSLIANFYRRAVAGTQGTFSFGGTRQRGNEMVYEAPWGYCRPVFDALRKRGCALEVRVNRSAGEVRLEHLEAGGFVNEDVENPLTSDLCLAYDLLYGETCEDVLRKAERRR